MFGLVATAPSIILVIFSVAFLHEGMQSWFGEKVEAAVGRSFSIADAYVSEHRRGLVRDAYALREFLEQPGPRSRIAAKSATRCSNGPSPGSSSWENSLPISCVRRIASSSRSAGSAK